MIVTSEESAKKARNLLLLLSSDKKLPSDHTIDHDEFQFTYSPPKVPRLIPGVTNKKIVLHWVSFYYAAKVSHAFSRYLRNTEYNKELTTYQHL